LAWKISGRKTEVTNVRKMVSVEKQPMSQRVIWGSKNHPGFGSKALGCT